MLRGGWEAYACRRCRAQAAEGRLPTRVRLPSHVVALCIPLQASGAGEGAQEAGRGGRRGRGGGGAGRGAMRANAHKMRKVLQVLGAVRGAAASVAAEAATEFMSGTDLRREVAYVRAVG